jgi:hypothetical protein
MASNSIPALAGIKGWSKIPQIRKISRDRAYTLLVTASGVFLAHGSVAFIITLAWERNVNKRPMVKKLDKPLSTDELRPPGPPQREAP